MKKLEILKELYFIIGYSLFYPAAVTSDVNVIIPDYDSVRNGNHGFYLDFQFLCVHIADDLRESFFKLVDDYNYSLDSFDQIEII